MKLQTKISLGILPLVATALFALGTWSVITATKGVEDVMFYVFEHDIRQFVDNQVVKSHRLLVDNGLANIPAYVKRYQQEAITAAGKIHSHQTGFLLIFDQSDHLVFCTCPERGQDASAWISVVEKIRTQPAEFVKGHLTTAKGVQTYIGHHFAPWGWTIIYKISAAELRQPGQKIGNATIVATLICAFSGFLMIFLILKRSVIRPVTALKQAADAVAAMEKVERIPVFSDDELGSLARSMEQMAGAIQGYRQEKEQWQQHLESDIADRTAELQQANRALQREIAERRRINSELKANESALNLALELKQASEERFRAIFESARDAVFVWDKTFRCLYANKAAVRQLNIPKEQLIGQHFRKAMAHLSDIAHVWEARVKQVFATESAMSVEDVNHVGKRSIYSESVLSPILDGQGTVFAVGVIFRNVTARKEMAQQISEALELNEKIVSASSMGIVAYSRDGQCVLANEAMAAMVGTSVKALMSQNYKSIKSWEESGLMAQAEAVLADGKERKYEIHATSTFGKEIWLNCMLSKFFRRGIPHLLLSVDDISERKRMQAQLEERNLALEESNRELDDFAYIASHDLREPLRGIANYAAFLMEDYADRLDGDGQDKLETLIRLCEREDRLIDSLLEYSRVGRTQLAIKLVDLNGIVAQVLERIDASVKAAQVDIRIPRPLPTVACDPIRIGEAYFNLITNALKYNDKSKKWIEIGYQTADNPIATEAGLEGSAGIRKTVFYISDNGIGIREGQTDKIFNIFKRLHGRDRYGGGVGAGLTIVKKIIERHNGKIWVTSTFGQGTTFYFTLETTES